MHILGRFALARKVLGRIAAQLGAGNSLIEKAAHALD